MDSRERRALNERMILIKEVVNLERNNGSFKVCGSSQNTYNVRIGSQCTCTCPDNCYRKSRCKHILFVLLRILEVEHDDLATIATGEFRNEILQQRKEYLDSFAQKVDDDDEVKVVDLSDLKSDSVIEVDEDVISVYEDENRKPVGDSHCPICLESMNEMMEDITYCSSQCGNNMHTVCVERWSAVSGKWECPLCRSEWE
jgi:hypothetical protein